MYKDSTYDMKNRNAEEGSSGFSNGRRSWFPKIYHHFETPQTLYLWDSKPALTTLADSFWIVIFSSLPLSSSSSKEHQYQSEAKDRKRCCRQQLGEHGIKWSVMEFQQILKQCTRMSL